LIGVGYDAYVCYGTAPKEITTKNESLMDCPFPLDHDDNMSDEDPEVDEDQLKTAKRIVHVEDKSNFNVEQKPARKSLFDEEIETKEKTAEEERLFNLINIDDD